MPDDESDENATDRTAALVDRHATQSREGPVCRNCCDEAQGQFSLRGDSCVEYNIYLFGQPWFSAMGKGIPEEMAPLS